MEDHGATDEWGKVEKRPTSAKKPKSDNFKKLPTNPIKSSSNYEMLNSLPSGLNFIARLLKISSSSFRKTRGSEQQKCRLEVHQADSHRLHRPQEPYLHHRRLRPTAEQASRQAIIDSWPFTAQPSMTHGTSSDFTVKIHGVVVKFEFSQRNGLRTLKSNEKIKISAEKMRNFAESFSNMAENQKPKSKIKNELCNIE